MNSDKSKVDATKKELTDLSKKKFDPKIQADINKRLNNIDKPVKK